MLKQPLIVEINEISYDNLMANLFVLVTHHSLTLISYEY
jgi:hypothetical protein